HGTSHVALPAARPRRRPDRSRPAPGCTGAARAGAFRRGRRGTPLRALSPPRRRGEPRDLRGRSARRSGLLRPGRGLHLPRRERRARRRGAPDPGLERRTAHPAPADLPGPRALSTTAGDLLSRPVPERNAPCPCSPTPTTTPPLPPAPPPPPPQRPESPPPRAPRAGPGPGRRPLLSVALAGTTAAAVGALGGPAVADGPGRDRGHDHDGPRIPGLDEVDVEDPQPFSPAVLERTYPSDREVDYVPLLSGFLGLQRDHPEILDENLARTLEINRSATADEEAAAIVDEYGDMSFTMGNALGERLGAIYQEAVGAGRLPRTTSLIHKDGGRAQSESTNPSK